MAAFFVPFVPRPHPLAGGSVTGKSNMEEGGDTTPGFPLKVKGRLLKAIPQLRQPRLSLRARGLAVTNNFDLTSSNGLISQICIIKINTR